MTLNRTSVRTLTIPLAGMLWLAATTAAAQQPAPTPPPPPPPPPPAAEAPAAAAAPAEAPPAPAAVPEAPPPAGEINVAPPSPEERLGAVEQKVEGMNEGLGALQTVVDGLAKLKFSGYIQGRYEWHDDSQPYLSAAGTVTELDRFFVRRGRLKAVYAGTNAEYLLQIDATGPGVTLKDAEATLVDTWTGLGLRLTIGQFKTPFGYEVLQSSQVREMPERSLVIRRLFPGERDRGLRLAFRADVFRFQAALINGTFDEAAFLNFDHSNYKDVVGRVGVDLGFLAVGLSGHFGRTMRTIKAAAAASVKGTDTDGNGTISGSEITFTPAAPAQVDGFGRWRVGLDAQAYVDVPEVGGLAVKGELILGGETSEGFSGVNGVAASKCRDAKQFGWIATVVQNFGDSFGAVVRVDQYDPNRSVSSECTDMAVVNAAAIDRVTTYGGGLLGYPSGNIKASLIYEHLTEQGTNKKDNDVFTAQLQASF